MLAFLLIFGAMRLLPAVERSILAHDRHMSLYVEVSGLADLTDLLERVRDQNAQVREVQLDRGRGAAGACPMRCSPSDCLRAPATNGRLPLRRPSQLPHAGGGAKPCGGTGVTFRIV